MPKAEKKSADDDALYRAYGAGKKSASVPPVSSKLDRRIKELAGISITDELEKSWLLGHGPRIILAVLLMFAIGLLFTLY